LTLSHSDIEVRGFSGCRSGIKPGSLPLRLTVAALKREHGNPSKLLAIKKMTVLIPLSSRILTVLITSIALSSLHD